MENENISYGCLTRVPAVCLNCAVATESHNLDLPLLSLNRNPSTRLVSATSAV
jgi:hypothetical protein